MRIFCFIFTSFLSCFLFLFLIYVTSEGTGIVKSVPRHFDWFYTVPATLNTKSDYRIPFAYFYVCIYVPPDSASTFEGNLFIFSSTLGLITVASWSKARTVFARSNIGIVDSNPTWVMEVCVRLFCVCAVLCVGSGLATGWSPVQGVHRLYKRLRNSKAAKVQQRVVDR
jgi:hypothetical protein